MAQKNARHGPGSTKFNQSQFISFGEVKQQARYQWPAILTGLGIDEVYLRNRHGSCPTCGGKDRFRFDDRDGHGTFYCNQCGPGDGFALLEKVHGWRPQEALRAVARWLGMAGYGPTPAWRTAPPKPATSPTPATIGKALARTETLWNEALSLDAPRAEPARAYLDYRGLGDLAQFPDDVRLHPSLPYWFADQDNRLIELGRYPALLALVRSLDGKVKGLHRTYLQPDGKGKALVQSPAGEALPARKLLSIAPGATRGCAVRLYPVGAENRLAVAEGIETALAVWCATGWPCWAALFAGNLAQFELPAGVEVAAIMADNDLHQAGQEAAKALARRLLLQPNPPIVKMLWPEQAGQDWLDVYVQQGGRQHG